MISKIKSASDVSFIHKMRYVSESAENGKKCMVGLGSVSEDNRVIQALIQLVQRMMDVTHRICVL